MRWQVQTRDLDLSGSMARWHVFLDSDSELLAHEQARSWAMTHPAKPVRIVELDDGGEVCGSWVFIWTRAISDYPRVQRPAMIDN
jgi:hypothetical protein